MKEKEIFSGHVFDVIQKEMTINGKNVIRDLVVHKGGAALSVIQDGKILLVKQTRAGAGCETLEIPAGTLEPNEPPEVTAMRELNEETGYECDSLELLCSMWPTPGYDTETIYIYKTSPVRPAAKRLEMDDTEDIEILWMDVEEAYRLFLKGELRDAKTIIAVMDALLSERKP